MHSRLHAGASPPRQPKGVGGGKRRAAGVQGLRTLLMVMTALAAGSMYIMGGRVADRALQDADGWEEKALDAEAERGSGGGAAAAGGAPRHEPFPLAAGATRDGPRRGGGGGGGGGRGLPLVEDQWAAFSNGALLRLPSGKMQHGNYTHMAMLEELPDGRLALAFQASARLEGAEDQQVWVAESSDTRGSAWKPPRALGEKMREAGMWSPVLHRGPGGRLLLFYAESSPQCLRGAINKPGKRGAPGINVPRRYSVGGNIKVVSRGLSGAWTPPRVVHSQRERGGVPKVIANKLIVLSSGRWVLPFWRQKSWAVCTTPKEKNSAGVLVSDDDGHSWAPRGDLGLGKENSWIIEGSAVEVSNRTLHMYFRSTEGFVYRSESKDAGETWGAAAATTIPNPDAKLHVARAPEGTLIMAFNDHVKDFTGISRKSDGSGMSSKQRDRLLVSVSHDGGASWRDVARLDPPVGREPAQRPPEMNGMLFHYPTVLPRADGSALVAYSRTYVDREVRSKVQNLAEDGIWVAKVPAGLLAAGAGAGAGGGGARRTFDPKGCKSADCVRRAMARGGVA